VFHPCFFGVWQAISVAFGLTPVYHRLYQGRGLLLALYDSVMFHPLFCFSQAISIALSISLCITVLYCNLYVAGNQCRLFGLTLFLFCFSQAISVAFSIAVCITGCIKGLIWWFGVGEELKRREEEDKEEAVARANDEKEDEYNNEKDD